MRTRRRTAKGLEKEAHSSAHCDYASSVRPISPAPLGEATCPVPLYPFNAILLQTLELPSKNVLYANFSQGVTTTNYCKTQGTAVISTLAL